MRVALAVKILFSAVHHTSGIDIDCPIIAGILNIFIIKSVSHRQNHLSRAYGMEKEFIYAAIGYLAGSIVKHIITVHRFIQHKRVSLTDRSG